MTLVFMFMPTILERLKTASPKERAAIMAERERLIVSNRFLVCKVVDDLMKRHKSTRTMGRHEAIAFGFVVLIQSVDRFNPEFGTKISTYIYSSVRNEIYDNASKFQSVISIPRGVWRAKRKSEQALKLLNLNVQIGMDTRRIGVRHESIPEPIADKLFDSEDITLLNKAMRRLDRRVRYILRERFWNKEKLKPIAVKLGITKERVRQLQEEGIESLGKLLEMDEGVLKLRASSRKSARTSKT